MKIKPIILLTFSLVTCAMANLSASTSDIQIDQRVYIDRFVGTTISDEKNGMIKIKFDGLKGFAMFNIRGLSRGISSPCVGKETIYNDSKVVIDEVFENGIVNAFPINLRGIHGYEKFIEISDLDVKLQKICLGQ
jgi:hypothetical protein